MSAPYLKCLIREQVDRALSLRDAIPDRLGHASLVRLAAACRNVLEEESRLLERAGALLDASGGGARAGDVLTIVKHCTRIISDVEGYGMPPLHCQSRQAVFLNEVMSAMHAEVGLPFPCPAVSCMSNEYYFTHQLTNTVYAPLLEAEFLLHMPDFYHELGHLLFVRSGEEELRPILDCMAGAIESVDDYYRRHVGGAGREPVSAPIQDGVEWMWFR